MVKLELNFQGLVLKEYTLQDGSRLTIGRHSDNDIVVKDRSASPHHAFFERKGENLIVHDFLFMTTTPLSRKSLFSFLSKPIGAWLIPWHISCTF
jgi:pSer/pThr/pTyr-binding forkhead associated (FHA) protein